METKEIEKIVFDLLMDDTDTVSVYTGGGDEPTYVHFVYSEDADKKTFLKSFSQKLTEKIITSNT